MGSLAFNIWFGTCSELLNKSNKVDKVCETMPCFKHFLMVKQCGEAQRCFECYLPGVPENGKNVIGDRDNLRDKS